MTWSTEMWPCTMQGSWKQMIFEVPSNSDHSMILLCQDAGVKYREEEILSDDHCWVVVIMKLISFTGCVVWNQNLSGFLLWKGSEKVRIILFVPGNWNGKADWAMYIESKGYNACQNDGELVKAGCLRAVLLIGKEGGLFQCLIMTLRACPYHQLCKR